MNTDQQVILKRLRRKVEIIVMDLKKDNTKSYHDAKEILSLIDLMERS